MAPPPWAVQLRTSPSTAHGVGSGLAGRGCSPPVGERPLSRLGTRPPGGGQTLALTLGAGLVCRTVRPSISCTGSWRPRVVASVDVPGGTERVPGRLRDIVGAVVLLAAHLDGHGLHLAHTPIESAWVIDIAAVDPGRGRCLGAGEHGATRRWTSPSWRRAGGRVMYVPGYRFKLRASMVQILLGGSQGSAGRLKATPCVCWPPGTSPVATHPATPRVAGSARTLLGWNRGRTGMSLTRDRLRWPCLTDAGTSSGGLDDEGAVRTRAPASWGADGGTPTTQNVTSAVSRCPSTTVSAASLTPEHEGRVRAGTWAVGRVAMMVGPGLPEGASPSRGGQRGRSGDGTAAALIGHADRAVLPRDSGLTERCPCRVPRPAPAARPLAAHRVDGAHSPYQTPCAPDDCGWRPPPSPAGRFDGRGRVLTKRAAGGRPATGEDAVIFREP